MTAVVSRPNLALCKHYRLLSCPSAPVRRSTIMPQYAQGCTSTDFYVALSGVDTPACGTYPSNPCYSIRHAVSLTHPNDTVYINALSYTSLNNTDSTFGCGDVTNNFTQATIVLRHSLSIIALDPRVVMDCGAVAPVFLIDGNGTDVTVIFDGFVFRNITQNKGTTGIAITAHNCRLVVTNSAFLGNQAHDGHLVGALYYHGNHLEISNSIFAGNDGPLLIETGGHHHLDVMMFLPRLFVMRLDTIVGTIWTLQSNKKLICVGASLHQN
uniref:Uncharacterized protein n=1 Tax=Branchiostoma floridae TaxID=7739 RepID=C3YJ99_BRAFL|eukprot:XP_002603586.1 hypothetical protein BRAFLDRAFT_93128 [Branchiostoma floridae]